MYKREIPFLVIEPTKTEYRALIDRIPDLQIFTPGKNKVSPFVINPFLPPKGITVEQYIPSLLSAFKAAFFSERYYMEFRDKIRDINTMCAYMNAVNQWLEKQDIKEGQEKRIQLCNCVKIKYLRKVLQEKEFRLSQKDREKILQVLVK